MFLSRKKDESALEFESGAEPLPKMSATIIDAPRPPAATLLPKPAMVRAAARAPVPDIMRLIVAKGVTLAGEISACDRLVVDGALRAMVTNTHAIEISATGRFIGGKTTVEKADIGGVYEGELTVRKRLVIRSTGRITGIVRCGELEIEPGGRLSGRLARIEFAD